jgi:hypothetical protein
MKYFMEISACKSPFGRPGRRRLDRTDRIDLTVGDLMMQTGLHWLGIGSSECENEHHCKFENILM